ncbi:S8 family serine peptidase [Undibacterium sp. RTI2.1]|uniref:S8 family peptidase n=1 Tax=unclassified Undibacterium TaxID=2630295 RepID=UPI002AB46093|nr:MULTISPECIES: S8 family serine peptidase [unclassified Undibacterium]MDY7540361.1 S8 family serine peptidase [Undibacterium sp. 5I1]MEB0029969.1 S8 family serine peptidase [Undibacterium sp. RTI2.1]MEB0117067.1 S8 family serine peptidase [Undibacterium sp. RTI2.2]MEB0229993.1 S8 family serine peptidase [Undibacterium sp. 10I3]MEB0258013.1 S8 family serine peptidase [Undibacterium sp. 5I1]
MKSLLFSVKPLLLVVMSTMLNVSVFAPAFASAVDPNSANSTKPQVEQKLSQIIIKYHNERSNMLESAASVGGNLTALAQVQAQRLSTLQSVAQTFGTSFVLKRQIVTGGWVYASDIALKPAEMRALAAKLASVDSTIEYAEPDYIRRPAYVPTDPLFSTNQWDMQDSKTQVGALNLPAAWDITMGQNIVVAVLDTGYRPHPDILPNLVPAQGGKANQYGYNFISSPAVARIALPAGASSVRGPDAIDLGDWVSATDTSCGPSNSSWHGTHVAGIVAAATNGIGITGVAPKAKVLPLRVLGKCGGYDSDIADAVAWAAGLHISGIPDNINRANVLNLSLGGTGVCTRTSATAYQSAIAAGTVIVIAAGNSSIDAKLSSPANCPGVITVASTSIAGGRASYSNYGGTVTVAAPGGGFTTANDQITSTLPTGTTVATNDSTYGMYSGTSQATPHVAGVVALMLSVNPRLTPAQVKSILIKTARPAPANCPGCGAGIVDAAAAVKAVTGG